VSLHPELASELARQRHREMLAQADRQRRVRLLVALARASRRAQWAERRMLQAIHKAVRLREGLQ